MKRSLFIFAGVLNVAGVLGAGWKGPLPTPAMEEVPATAEYNFDFTYGGAPKPTAAPNVPFAELIKRQQATTTVCGLLSTNTSWSWTCRGGNICGFNTVDRKNFGCCTSYASGTLSGCYLPTTCYDSTAAVSITCGVSDVPCVWSSMYCSSSAYPFCGKFVQGVMTAYDCFTAPNKVYNLVAPGVDGATIVTSSRTGLSSGSSGSSIASVTGTTVILQSPSSDSGPDRVPFTQQQQTVGSTRSTTAATSTSTSTNMAPGMSRVRDRLCGILIFVWVFL